MQHLGLIEWVRVRRKRFHSISYGIFLFSCIRKMLEYQLEIRQFRWILDKTRVICATEWKDSPSCTLSWLSKLNMENIVTTFLLIFWIQMRNYGLLLIKFHILYSFWVYMYKNIALVSVCVCFITSHFAILAIIAGLKIL